MKPASFDYVVTHTLQEAVDALAGSAGDGKVLAGGQSLVPLMNLRLARPSLLVDINRVAGLDAIREVDGELRIGALVRHSELLADPRVAAGWPLLAEAAALIGHAAIRNRGTVGGSIAHADPAAELPAVLAALGGRVVATGPAGAREIAASDLFLTYLTTALAPDEVLTEVIMPAAPPGSGTAFVEFARRGGDFALVGVAAVLAPSAAGDSVASANLTLVGVGSGPVLVPEASSALAGAPLAGEGAAEAWAEAGRLAAAAIAPDDDVAAPASYRRDLAATLCARALGAAAGRAAQDRPAGGRTSR